MTPPSQAQNIYEEALAYIASLAPRGWRLGLDRMQELVDRAGLANFVAAKEKARFIHVAGTNGKGSVTAYLQSIFVESGLRSGAFFSPFVYDIRERLQSGRNLISPSDMARLTFWLQPIAESLTGSELGAVTEFEFKTALGFQYWKEKECGWVALEVGLGGRLDSTNVVQPAATVIVSIGLDHVNLLGNSYEEIAYEKAGIIKPGIPVVVGHMCPEALGVVEKEAAEKDAPIWRYGKEILVELMGNKWWRVITPVGSHDGLKPGLFGQMQVHNMALAVAALDAVGFEPSELALKTGTRHAALPGRFEHRMVQGRDVILDGAHNAEAATVLAQNLRERYPDRRILMLTGMVAGHDPVRFYEPLLPLVDSVHLVPIQFHRALPPEELVQALADFGPSVTAYESLHKGLTSVLNSAEDRDLVLVTGSFYLIGELSPLMRSL